MLKPASPLGLAENGPHDDLLAPTRLGPTSLPEACFAVRTLGRNPIAVGPHAKIYGGTSTRRGGAYPNLVDI